MSKTNDEIMQDLLTAKRQGEQIFYGDTADTRTTEIEDDHTWDLNNNMYLIRRRREYIIQVMNDNKKNPIIHSTENHWTRSDFGNSEMCEYVLMREVYPEDM